MAFRIHDSVVRGEIDNRTKGTVRGKVWVEGRAEPVVLELQGNAWPDLAGCFLTFTNPLPRVPHASLASLDSMQRGSIGDLTASRKVRVFDVPLQEALEMSRRQEKPPEHMANSLYLEWFSEANGRVVIESADYALEISTPEWRPTPEEETDRARQAAEGMVDFMQRLSEAVALHQRGQKDPEEEWDEHDYEKFLKECDARTEKYGELLDKYGDSDEADAIIAREMGWDEAAGQSDGEKKGGDESEDDRLSIEEMNAIYEASENEPEPEPDPSREGIDWIRGQSGELSHPLESRCSESAVRLYRQIDELGLDKSADNDLDDFLFEFQRTGVKLAGALNPLARGIALPDPAFTVAYLKRGLSHLHKAQAALEALTPKKLLPEAMVAEARKELFEIREGILRLMDELRGRA